jgi:hypothetical protein
MIRHGTAPAPANHLRRDAGLNVLGQSRSEIFNQITRRKKRAAITNRRGVLAALCRNAHGT